MTDPRDLPTGRIGRFARLAALGARTSVSLLTSRDGSGAAAKAAEVLGELRGLAAKVGQMASYIDGVVPPAHRAAYGAALEALRAAAPSSSPEAIQKMVEEELGAPIDRLFSEWEREPFASASIGEVHRARLLDGRAVAVKVQHPGIDHAIESDLQNAGILESLVGSLGPKALDTKNVFDDIRARFREELDYRLEAEHQRTFARFHAGDPLVSIPEVIAERSSRRVLTSELVSGLSLSEAAKLSEAERRAYAHTLWRFVFKGTLIAGLFNADPHPGNYYFQAGGKVVFLDFGCVQPIDGTRRVAARLMHQSAVSKDEAGFRSGVTQIMKTRGGSYEQKVVAYVRRCFEPLFASPFKIDPDYVADLVRSVRDMKAELFAKDKSFVMPPRGLAFMNRLQFGFYSVLAQLAVEADYAEVERVFLRDAQIGV